ncbi:MAG: hypothetical protein PHD32_04500 [Eubacteriales bacterium]|nr:hypothetical protein [Eubacteriales bacterium]
MEQRMILEIPAAAENMLVVRLTVSGACTRLNFTVDALEDAKVAVAEACLMLMQGKGCEVLRVTLRPSKKELLAEVEALGEGEPLPQDEEYDAEYSRLMLAALTEELTVQETRVTLRVAGEI